MTAAPVRVAAVTGIGTTGYLRDSGRSEWELAIEAIDAAVEDAGLRPSQIDGVIRYSADRVNEAMLAEAFGWSLAYHSQVGFGGQSAAAVLGHAAAAIQAGLASAVVCYRALNGRSHARYGRAEHRLGDADASTSPLVTAAGRMAPQGAFTAPYGLLAPGQVMAMWARRYAADAGIDDDTLVHALGSIAVAQRQFANANPLAYFRDEPLTLDRHREARMISDPLRLYDFCLETDGAAAVVVTEASLAASGPHAPAWVSASHQGLREESMELYSEPINGPIHRAGALRMFESAGIAPSEIEVAQLYDASSIMVLMSLETYGLAEPGTAWRSVIEDGIGADAPISVNTSGGHLSEGYVHGFNHLLEAVRQVRGDSPNQRTGANHVLIGAAGASGAIVSR